MPSPMQHVQMTELFKHVLPHAVVVFADWMLTWISVDQVSHRARHLSPLQLHSPTCVSVFIELHVYKCVLLVTSV